MQCHGNVRAVIAAVVAMMCSGFIAFSQVEHAMVSVIPVEDPRLDRIVFDLELIRSSDNWELWGNGTFRLTNPALEATGGLDSLRFTIAYVPQSSTLPIVGYNADALSGYVVQCDLQNGRLNISILGPDASSDCYRIQQKNVPRKLGQFVLQRNDGGQLLGDLQWVAPMEYYQANAFKIDHDSVTGEGAQRNTWYNTDDNVPLVTRYVRRPRGDSCDRLLVTSFTGTYIGDLAVSLQFDTECEINVDGFFIERALVLNGDFANLEFATREQLDHLNNATLRSCVCKDGRTYANLLDGVEFRRELYAYRLASRETGTGIVTFHDTIFVRIPSPIISNARLLQNPFRDQTTVEFNIDDRVWLTAAVYDLGGRFLSRLLAADGTEIVNKEYPKGASYTATFLSPEVAAAGLYNIVLIAIPYDRLAIEQQSRVVLKAQLLR